MKRWIILFLLIPNLAYGGISFKISSPIKQTTLENGAIVKHHSGITIPQNSIINTKGKITTPMKLRYSIIDTSLSTVETILMVKLLKRINEMSEKYPYQEIVVIDWGCGTGKAIHTLANQAKRLGLKNVKFIGFSNLYFPRWKRTSGVEFIFDEMENLHKYLKKESVGIIYSHFGLFHIPTDMTASHLNKLAPYILEGGLVVTNVMETSEDAFVNASPNYKINNHFTEYYRIVKFTRTSSPINTYPEARDYFITLRTQRVGSSQDNEDLTKVEEAMNRIASQVTSQNLEILRVALSEIRTPILKERMDFLRANINTLYMMLKTDREDLVQMNVVELGKTYARILNGVVDFLQPKPGASVFSSVRRVR